MLILPAYQNFIVDKKTTITPLTAQIVHHLLLNENVLNSYKLMGITSAVKFGTTGFSASHTDSLNDLLNADIQIIQQSTTNEKLSSYFIDAYRLNISENDILAAQQVYTGSSYPSMVKLLESRISNKLPIGRAVNFSLVVKSTHSDATYPILSIPFALTTLLMIQPFFPYVTKQLRAEIKPDYTILNNEQEIAAGFGISATDFHQAIADLYSQDSELLAQIKDNLTLDCARRAHTELLVNYSPNQFTVKMNEDGSTETIMPLFDLSIQNAKLCGFIFTPDQPRWKELFLFQTQTGKWVATKFENSSNQNEVTRFHHLITDDPKELQDFFKMSKVELPFIADILLTQPATAMSTRL